ncbi:MAG: hypothetical protein SVV03_05470 [Candidatus Nanohaloarchaea archaeon]|nr:hypothetical protein [Candidatus Nanohaloarchaea archaeon]
MSYNEDTEDFKVSEELAEQAETLSDRRLNILPRCMDPSAKDSSYSGSQVEKAQIHISDLFKRMMHGFGSDIAMEYWDSDIFLEEAYLSIIEETDSGIEYSPKIEDWVKYGLADRLSIPKDKIETKEYEEFLEGLGDEFYRWIEDNSGREGFRNRGDKVEVKIPSSKTINTI